MKKVSKITLFFLMSFIGFNSTVSAESLFSRCKASVGSYGKNAFNHVFSLKGLKDMGAAYALGMAITTIHELGHGLAAKYFYGSPLDITIGTDPDSNPLSSMQIGGIRLGGLNPATGYSKRQIPADATPLSKGLVSLAGPVCGTIASIAAYKLLTKYAPKLYIARFVSLFGLYNHTLGVAGIGGHNRYGSDAYRIK